MENSIKLTMLIVVLVIMLAFQFMLYNVTQLKHLTNAIVNKAEPSVIVTDNEEKKTDPPLRENPDFPIRNSGIAINTPTQGLPTNFNQVGALITNDGGEKMIIPLMGRKLHTTSDRWNYFDYSMSFWEKWSKESFWNTKNNYIDLLEQIFWKSIYKNLYVNKIKSWNYKWQSFIWKKNGYFIHPHLNLVENNGFSNFSSNTKRTSKKILFRKKQKLNNFFFQKNLKFHKNDDLIIFDKIYFSLNHFISNNPLGFLYLSIVLLLSGFYEQYLFNF